MTKRVLELDQPISTLDDWDLLQAAFEAMLQEIGQLPGFDMIAVLEREFPIGQSKAEQIARLKQMLSQRNEWGYGAEPPENPVPTDVLEEALRRINNEADLAQGKSVRALILGYREASTSPEKPCAPARRLSWSAHFGRDFFEFLANKRLEGEALLKIPVKTSAKAQLQPGAIRTLAALKEACPQGLTVKALGPLTVKDSLSDETPPDSLYVWLNKLKSEGLVRSNPGKPKKWFFVQDP